jgi:hypothetical protein
MPTISSDGNGWLLKEMTMEKCVWLRDDGMVVRTWYYPAFSASHGEEYRLLWSGPFNPALETEIPPRPAR